jgi:hypothetical protein
LRRDSEKIMKRQSVVISTIFLALIVASGQSALAQRRLPDEETSKPVREPKGAKAPTRPSLGVLFVLTDPPGAKVVIKNSAGRVVSRPDQKSNDEGEFRIELRPGKYTVESALEKFVADSGPKTVSVISRKYEIVQIKLNPLYGSITLKGSFDPEVQILVDGKVATNVKKSNKQIDLADLTKGNHLIQVKHPALETWEEEIEVKGGDTATRNVTLRVKRAGITVTSEPDAVIYLDGTPQQTVGKDGRAMISDIEPGSHTVRAQKELYENAEQRVALKPGEQKTIDLKLTPVALSPAIADSFAEGLRFWDAPSTWAATGGQRNTGVIVKGPGMGFAKNLVNDRHHVYKDFRMTFTVSLLNGKGAVWFVRARDEKNYYIFQLSGPAGKQPGYFSSYVCCQNGGPRPLTSPVPAPVDLGKAGNLLHITLEARGKTITHKIESNSDPKPEGPRTLSELPNILIPQGGLGFGTLDGEEFIVRFFSIAPIP